jgi:hypothetical protein
MAALLKARVQALLSGTPVGVSMDKEEDSWSWDDHPAPRGFYDELLLWFGMAAMAALVAILLWWLTS